MTINTAGYTLGSNRPLTNARILWNMMQGTATGDGTNPDRAANDYTAQRWMLGAGANDWVLTGPVAGYDANGITPEFVADFTGGVYRVDSAASTFADAFTYSATSTRTFVDSTGIIKWSPHNLLSYSEDMTNFGWTTSNSTVDSATDLTFTTAAGSFTRLLSSQPKGEYTLRCTISGDTPGDTFNLEIVDGADGSDENITVVTVPSTPTQFEVVADLNTATFSGFLLVAINRTADQSVTAGSTITITDVHLYRSDLGGMADNPATQSKYVPTVASAVYLARTDHHIWNGSEWTGPFLQLESEARTNLVTYSQFDAGVPTDWSVGFGTGTFSHTLGTQIQGTPTITHVQSASGRSYLGQTLTLSPSTTYTFSVKIDLTVSEITGGNEEILGIFNFTGLTNIVKTLDDVDPITGLLSVTFTTPSDGVGELRLGIGVVNVSEGTVRFSQPQIEAGSTPSSWIPTTSASATRNAETLTIAAADAPWSATAVSIQMEGTITYTDEDSFVAARFYNWIADASNLISCRLNDGGTRTGAVDFQQTEGGVLSASNQPSPGSYTPGVNVPFNIAARHGTTFVNGAIDGVALTANTTPTALPDLSAADIDIGPDFMGSIGRIVIAADDFGDAGIAAASNPSAAAVDVDTAFIAAHNLSGRTVTISTSPDLFTAYTTRATVAPTDNTTIAALFNDGSGDPIPTRRLKVSVDEGDGNAIGIIRAGEALQMEQSFYAGHTPATKARVTEGEQSFSETGQWQGRTVKRVALTPEYNWRHLSKTWYDANFEPFAQTLPAQPFGIAGNPSAMPDDVAWAWTDQDARPSTMGLVDLVQVSLSVTGLR